MICSLFCMSMILTFHFKYFVNYTCHEKLVWIAARGYGFIPYNNIFPIFKLIWVPSEDWVENIRIGVGIS